MPYMTEMSQAYRKKLPRKDFVFPNDRGWPIQTRKQAMTALTWSTWPQHRKAAKKVREAVFAKYPDLRKKFSGGKYKKESRSLGKLGDSGAISERLQRIHDIVGQAEDLREHHDPNSVAQMFAEQAIEEEVSYGDADSIGAQAADYAMKLVKKKGLKVRESSLRSAIASHISANLRRFSR